MFDRHMIVVEFATVAPFICFRNTTESAIDKADECKLKFAEHATRISIHCIRTYPLSETMQVIAENVVWEKGE